MLGSTTLCLPSTGADAAAMRHAASPTVLPHPAYRARCTPSGTAWMPLMGTRFRCGFCCGLCFVVCGGPGHGHRRQSYRRTSGLPRPRRSTLRRSRPRLTTGLQRCPLSPRPLSVLPHPILMNGSCRPTQKNVSGMPEIFFRRRAKPPPSPPPPTHRQHVPAPYTHCADP